MIVVSGIFSFKFKCVTIVLNQRVGGSSPPSAYALRQGILSTIFSLDPGVVNGYIFRNLFLEMLQRQWLQGLKPG